MLFKANNGTMFIQFYAEDEKQAKNIVKQHAGFSLIKDDFPYAEYIEFLDSLRQKLVIPSAIAVEHSDIEIQEARDYASCGKEILAPYLIKKYGKENIDEKVNEILLAVASKKEELLKQQLEAEIKLSKIKEAREYLFKDTEKALKLIDSLKAV